MLKPFLLLLTFRFNKPDATKTIYGWSEIKIRFMKQVSLLFILVAFISCAKTENAEPENSLFGKWSEYENYISPGTAWHWQPASNITIEIKSNLTYTTSNDNYFWGKSGTIENLTDSSFVLKSPALNREQKCSYKFKDGILEIWYFGCIEGCGSRFKRKFSLN
jgi:hypothetical protein